MSNPEDTPEAVTEEAPAPAAASGETDAATPATAAPQAQKGQADRG